MTRPADWTPIGRSQDPLPGDPDVVSTYGRHYQDVANAIDTAASRLRQIASMDDVESEAVAAVTELAGQVSDDISRASTRYREVGGALTVYAVSLDSAQATGDAALAAARAAQDDLSLANQQLTQARSELRQAQQRADTAAKDPNAAPVDLTPYQRAVYRAGEHADSAQQDLQNAQRRLANAEHDRDDAAQRAVRSITDVEQVGDLNDSWWDDWGNKVVKVIADVASTIATVAGILSLVVGWIPVIGQALAAVLGTIALIASIVSLVANLSLALTGYGDWTDVLFDAISVATFGVGSAFAKGAKAAYSGARAATRLSAGKLAAQSASSRLAAGLPGGSTGSALRALTGSRSLANVSRNSARTVVKNAGKVPPISWTAPFKTGWSNVTALKGQVSFIANPANLAAAARQTPQALRTLVKSPSLETFIANLTQEQELAQFVTLARSAHPAALATEQMAKATRLALVQGGAFTTGATVDIIQAPSLFGGPTAPTPAQTLHLPGSPQVTP